VKLWM